MRHFRMPGASNIKNIHSFEKQVEIILKQIDKFNDSEKDTAYSYIQKRISKKTSLFRTNESSSRSTKKQRKKSTVSMKKIDGFAPKRKKIMHNVKVKPPILKCKLCSVTKRTKLNFLIHLKSHPGTPISCRKCRKSFNNKLAFDFHIAHICNQKVKNTSKTYTCKECSMEFDFKRHYTQHIEGHKRNNCPYCEVMLTRRSDLIRHLLSVHSIKLVTAWHKCNFCEKRYVRQRSLFYHLRQHSENKHVCMECGQICDTIEELALHEDDHKKQKPWKCPKCDDRFIRKQQYENHLKRHNTYKCITCNETYASKQRALRHKQRGHNVDGLQPKMQCPYCEKAFHRSYYLQVHMKKHSDSNKSTIPCTYCKKTFKTHDQYIKHCSTTRHEKKSPDQNSHFCCGRKFKKKYLIEQHLQVVHNKAKEMMGCEFCDYKTYNRGNLERHRDLHLNSGKEYICDQCGKEFPNIPALKSHISYIHMQERAFKCEQCGKSFKRKSELTRHAQIHLNISPHVCQICNAAFKRSSHLKRHEMSVHKTMPKIRKVQRLERDSNGVLVPVDKKTKALKPEPSPPTTMTTIMPQQQPQDNFVEVVNMPQLDYFSLPVSNVNDMVLPKNMNSNIISLEPVDYNQSVYWNKLKPDDLYTTDNNLMPQMSLSTQGNEFQALNIVDQLVNSFLPDKIIPQDSLCDDYTNQALQYTNIGLPTVTSDFKDEILTTTERILQGQCDKDVILDTPLSDYIQPYQYMQ